MAGVENYVPCSFKLNPIKLSRP